MPAMPFKVFWSKTRKFAAGFPPERDQFGLASRVISQLYASGSLAAENIEHRKFTETSVEITVYDHTYRILEDDDDPCVVIVGLGLVWRPTEAEKGDHCWLSVAMAAAIEGYYGLFEAEGNRDPPGSHTGYGT